jgi:hypothetical protein
MKGRNASHVIISLHARHSEQVMAYAFISKWREDTCINLFSHVSILENCSTGRDYSEMDW